MIDVNRPCAARFDMKTHLGLVTGWRDCNVLGEEFWGSFILNVTPGIVL